MTPTMVRSLCSRSAAATMVGVLLTVLAGAGDAAASSGDDGWALIAAVAEDGGQDDELLAPQAGQVELSISALSPEERTALARELAAELAPGRVREG